MKMKIKLDDNEAIEAALTTGQGDAARRTVSRGDLPRFAEQAERVLRGATRHAMQHARATYCAYRYDAASPDALDDGKSTCVEIEFIGDAWYLVAVRRAVMPVMPGFPPAIEFSVHAGRVAIESAMAFEQARRRLFELGERSNVD